MDFKIVFIVSCLLSASCTDPIGSKSDRLKIEADTLNAHCPQKLDSETELQKVNWSPSKHRNPHTNQKPLTQPCLFDYWS